MKNPEKKLAKELYQQLRSRTWEELWLEEVPRFNQAPAPERNERVALVRAVGVVFSESGDPAQKEEVKQWLLALLQDPGEKIRRYAMAALPKIGAGQSEEAELLAVLKTTGVEREKKFAARALEKIGGAATLETLQSENPGLLPQTERKLRASLAREENPSAIRMDGALSEFDGLRVHLRGRRGLEGIVRDEVEEFIRKHGKFRFADFSDGLVALTPIAPFTLADIYTLRCFGTVGFVPGRGNSTDSIAEVIASPLSRRVLQAFTDGTIRYRLNFVNRGHQRSAVRSLADRVYALCPEILNDARDVTWTVDLYPGKNGETVELRPNLTPDPRYYYRQKDVPAASHPQLAAAMARLAGPTENEIVWDPFCGCGMELIERALLGGTRIVHGTDLSGPAISVAQKNFATAGITRAAAHFVCSDFRDYAESPDLGQNSVTLMITNPPLGMRVPVVNLRELIADVFAVADRVLRPGGRLVFANPTPAVLPPHSLKLVSRLLVDFGGFDCRVEKYVKKTQSDRGARR